MQVKFKLALIMCLFASMAQASFEGIDRKALNQYLITGFSRPCCTFGLNPLDLKLGISGVMDKENMGGHHFARLNKKNDTVGMIYTCTAGFIDVSHLRDNADWAAHIFYKLPQWLGSEREVLARLEGGFSQRAVYFPKLTSNDINSLTEDDLEKIAIAMGFDMALMHEIPTSFNFAVSVPNPFTNEKASAFSVEDAYSNLLGNYLGVQAARSPLPYNQAMTEIIKDKLDSLGAQGKSNTIKAFNSVRNKWWIKGLSGGFKDVLKRNFDFVGSIRPFLIPDAPFCANFTQEDLVVPHLLSNGKSVHDYYEIRGTMKKRFIRSLGKLGIELKTLTQKEYPVIIEAIQKKFIRQLGEDIVVR